MIFGVENIPNLRFHHFCTPIAVQSMNTMTSVAIYKMVISDCYIVPVRYIYIAPKS